MNQKLYNVNKLRVNHHQKSPKQNGRRAYFFSPTNVNFKKISNKKKQIIEQNLNCKKEQIGCFVDIDLIFY